MQIASIDDGGEALGHDDGATRHLLSDALETTGMAINHYRLEAGTGLPGGLHAHEDQEEVFAVLAGAATFETLDGTVDVAGGAVIRFAPGEFQSGKNGGDEPVELLALGAPRETEDVRVPVACQDCGHDDLRLDEDGATFVCPDCGAERVPEPCPDCGSELRMTLDDASEPVAACADCGAVFERPPLRE